MPAHSHRMLIVEDHELSLRALSGIFTRMGWRVDAAGTVAEAMDLLEAGPEPCCVLLDLDLPDGRGEDVLARIREKGLGARVVVATGRLLCGDRLVEVAGLRPDALLQKPIAIDAVWDDLCRVCEAG